MSALIIGGLALIYIARIMSLFGTYYIARRLLASYGRMYTYPKYLAATAVVATFVLGTVLVSLTSFHLRAMPFGRALMFAAAGLICTLLFVEVFDRIKSADKASALTFTVIAIAIAAVCVAQFLGRIFVF